MSKHVLIVGAGVIGLCTAYYAAERGYRVTICERGTANDEGCSFGNSGMIVPSHFIPLAAPGMIRLALKWMWKPTSPFYMKPRLDRHLFAWAWRFRRSATAEHVIRSAPLLRDLNNASLACFQELARASGNEFGLIQNGIIMVCKTEHGLADETRTAAMARNLGIPVKVLDGDAVAAMEPDMRMNVAGGVYFPNDACVTPSRFMASMRNRLHDTEIAWNTPVTGWRTSGNRIEAVETPRGDMSADEYLICGGSWSPDIARSLGVRLPMQAGKGYSLTLPHRLRTPRHAMILTEARVAVTPMGEAVRFGGTMEITGNDTSISPARVRGIINAVPRYLPYFGADDFHGVLPWAGLRPCSPDGLPYLGRVSRFANLSVATGHAMMGLSLGPITGKLMSELLSGDRTSIPIEALSPERFA